MANLTIQNKWKKVIKDRGLKISWVASKAGISQSHLSNILVRRAKLLQETADKINKALGTDYKM